MDCTLRDGGYYNHWDFEKKLAIAMVKGLSNAAVNIVKIGYKAPPSYQSGNFEGLFRFCTESQLQFLKEYPNLEFAFMIDVKEFLVDEKVDQGVIESSILSAADSLFDWVRVATHHNTYAEAIELAAQFKTLGYKTTINLMGMSLLSEEQVVQDLQATPADVVDVFYFADSFGSLREKEVVAYTELIRKHYQGKIGFHAHDNQGLAFANALSAIEMGVDFIDSTIMGMGRGAGNLKTEQLLPYLYYREGYTSLNPTELLDVIDNHFLPLHQKYQWGWDYSYMLGALQNIHPTYCQHLRSTRQYTIEQISHTLGYIEHDKRNKYSETELLRALDVAVTEPLGEKDRLIHIPTFVPEKNETVLIIGGGTTVNDFSDEIVAFIEQHDPLVIETHLKKGYFRKCIKKLFESRFTLDTIKRNTIIF